MWNAVPFTHRHAQWSLYAKTNFRWRPRRITSSNLRVPNMNIFVACFTTCWARLPRGSLSTQSRAGAVLRHWFHHLLVSTQQTHATPTRLSWRIYQQTQTRGSGPNNYWYRIKDGTVNCKVRSFTLQTGTIELWPAKTKHHQQSHQTHRTTERETQVYNPHKIKRDTNTKTLKTIKETKRYKVIFDKRIADPDTFKLYPYGYKKQPTLLDEDLSQAQDAQMPSSMMWTWPPLNCC